MVSSLTICLIITKQRGLYLTTYLFAFLFCCSLRFRL